MDVSAEARVRVAPEPLRVDPVRTTELLCPDLDLSVSLTPERPADRRRRQVRFNVDPVLISVIPEPRKHPSTAHDPTDRDGRSHNLGRECDRGRGGACDGQLTDGAELNTTLALRAELQEEAEKTFDPEKAVKEKLQSSTLTKNHINSKAAEGLNFPRSQHLYRALVSVSLSRDQLISQALQDRPALIPPTTSLANKTLEGPDLLPFYCPEKMLREAPLLPGDRFPLPRPRPVPRPAHTTFHLHHLHKLWES